MKCAMLMLGALLLVACSPEGPKPSTFSPQLAKGEFVIHAPGGSGFGDWSQKVYCPNGSYAVGFSLQIEESCGGGCDDTALNGVRILCSNGTTVESGHRVWGGWRPPQECAAGEAAYAYSLGVEHYLGGKEDDTSANSLKVRCRKIGSYDVPTADLAIHGPFADTWTAWARCPVNSMIVGLLTRDEKSQGSGDDTATNDVMFICSRRS